MKLALCRQNCWNKSEKKNCRKRSKQSGSTRMSYSNSSSLYWCNGGIYFKGVSYFVNYPEQPVGFGLTRPPTPATGIYSTWLLLPNGAKGRSINQAEFNSLSIWEGLNGSSCAYLRAAGAEGGQQARLWYPRGPPLPPSAGDAPRTRRRMANLNLHPHDGEREGACLDLAGDRKEERVRTRPAAAILCDSAGREDPATSSLAASPPYPRADLMDGRSGRGCGTTATELGMGHGDGGAVANGNPWVRDACGEEAPEEKVDITTCSMLKYIIAALRYIQGERRTLTEANTNKWLHNATQHTKKERKETKE